MWKLPINFITLHYAYILTLGILAFIVIYPYGNIRAIDAYYFGASASTSSGLNPIDLKALKTYQQVWLYFTPILANLGFVNIIVVVVRLRWFNKKLKGISAAYRKPTASRNCINPEIKDLTHVSETSDVEGGHIDASISEQELQVSGKHEKNGPLSQDELGGVEYRALRILLKIVAGYFFGLHLFGAICLIPWIHLAPSRYREYLASQGQNPTWWAMYSSQTMISNLGLTLTPDGMISFRDATWPMLVMCFLGFAGNTFYPVFLRLVIWLMWKVTPASSSTSESLRFLLDRPRRCYTLLFPSTVTWVLAAILVFLNFIDTLVIVVLDLDNPEVNVLPLGPRILAALFQSVCTRHTGTAAFNLANLNPATQLSLVVMMYISVYPIAVSIRMSESYEDRSVARYATERSLDDNTDGKTYLINIMRIQLSFDLWFIFLGVFCICCAESKRVMSHEDWAFSVFAILFEVVSAYCNVGISLGYPTNLAALSGQFTVFSKLVICAMMVRGRHRGLPHGLDRTINLPNDPVIQDEQDKYRDSDTEHTLAH
ncbi:hypothetical protein yc1106_06881 [Curvularia clavata]|uniref:Uncharacterized protein n=1 Tax=Curvularia clavata TaxID=95742 RepID=A0A9Q8ZCL5_CURCL|nr:hypothetical protein yc1106_06881 [Curvularia clavata]